MKKITNSFIKNIVRQSLTESYGLLNEQVEPYSETLPNDFAGIPAGTVLTNMTVPEKPDGGFSVYKIDAAEKDANSKSREELFDICTTYYPSNMGTPLIPSQKIMSTTTKMMVQLNDTAINADTILDGLKVLSDFASFCSAYEFSKTKASTYKDAQNLKIGMLRDDGADSWTNDDQGDYYDLIAEALQNSIEISKTNKTNFATEAKAQYKIVTDKAAADKAAADKAAADKAAEENKVKIGGAGEENFMINHPTLVKSSKLDLSAKDGSWNARVYKLDTGDKTIDKFLYGVIVGKDGAPLAVKFRDDVTTEPLTLDPDTDWRLKYGTSQTDTWKYNDVIVSADGKDIALTTDPIGEEKFEALQTESYRHKGFRYNLLTEVELKLKDKGEEVGKIQKKLQLPPDRGIPTFGPDTLKAVINHQKTKGLKRTDGFVDEETYTSIMALEDPAFELSFAKKSKGDDVKLIQQKLGVKDDGGFGTDTEIAVKAFQETNKNLLPTSTPGVVDQATFDLIKRFKGANSRKVFSGDKTNYVAKDWIIITPNRGAEGNIFIDQKYYKIKSVSADRMTVVLDLPIGVSGLSAEDYKTLKVGGMTAKVLFGNEAEGLTKNAPVSSNDNDNDSGSGEGQSNSGTGKRQDVSGNKGTGTTVDPEKQRKRDIRKKETCNTLRQIKQYLNNTKGLSMTVNCKWNQEIRNQVMLALTGGTPAPKEEPEVNTQPVPVTDKLF